MRKIIHLYCSVVPEKCQPSGPPISGKLASLVSHWKGGSSIFLSLLNTNDWFYISSLYEYIFRWVEWFMYCCVKHPRQVFSRWSQYARLWLIDMSIYMFLYIQNKFFSDVGCLSIIFFVAWVWNTESDSTSFPVITLYIRN